jgi:hypothetical protein
MHTRLSPLFTALETALDAASEPLDFFLRDDDAGWDDTRLFALLDCTAAAAVPLDLAAIPTATSPALAAALCARMQTAPELLGVHQHGYQHQNHEQLERKCEFGPARSASAQRADLRAGRDRLLDLFGARLDAFFTPPWNRCSPDTPPLLAELGFAALSRSRGAPAQPVLPSIDVDVDWCKQRRMGLAEGQDGAAHIAADLARAVQRGGCVGLMLHHAVMDEADLALLRELLQALQGHPRVRWQRMRQLVHARVDTTGTELAAS